MYYSELMREIKSKNKKEYKLTNKQVYDIVVAIHNITGKPLYTIMLCVFEELFLITPTEEQ